jgi:hypothetical protein
MAKAINSFTLNLPKNQSHHQSFFQKKYINQKTGEIIVYIHIYIHLIIKTIQSVIINIEYTITNNKSKTILTTKSHNVCIFSKSFLSTFEIVSKDKTQ